MTKVAFISLGCSKNLVDTEVMLHNLHKAGFEITFETEEAEIVVVNTCGFIESAKQESLESVFAARSEFPEKKIVLCGCLAERYAESFATELAGEVDAILGNGDLSLLDSILDEINLEKSNKPIIKKAPQEGICSQSRKLLLGFPGSAYVKITEGCNNCCSFCAIPIIRGRLRSRSDDEIIGEIKELISKGIFEINLIGQDLAAYGRDGILVGKSNHPSYFEGKTPLATLLEKISSLEGDFWIRLLYIHPQGSV